MKKEKRKILPNILLCVIIVCLFVSLIITYGKYNFCLKGETSKGGYSVALVMLFFTIVASYPLFGTFMRRDLMGKMPQISWLIIHASILSSALVFVGIAFCRSIFESQIYNAAGSIAHSNSKINFWTMLLLQEIFSLVLFIVSLCQSISIRKNHPEIGDETVSQLRLNRNNVGYLAINEIVFLILVLMFYILEASYFGECIIFRGVEAASTNTTGIMIFNIADNLESLSEIMLFGTPIVTFVILKKKEQQEVMRIVPQVSAAISAIILAIMLYYVAIYNKNLYNGDYELVKSSSGQVVTIAGLFVVPIILAIILLAVSVLKIYEQRKSKSE